jgi:hypothetical protein
MRSPSMALLVGLVGCGQEYGLSGLEPAPVEAGADEAVAVGVRRDPRPVATPSTSTSAGRPVDRPRRPRSPRPEFVAQEVPLGGGARTEVVDFLFVVDNSSSMKRIVDQVFDGFDALVAEGAFPKDARIAVTSTLPADPDRPGRPHPSVHKGSMMRWDPGFQHLVSAEGIQRFRAEFPVMADSFALDGCDPWFAPGERSAQGVPCLEAHTQLALVGVGTEAGLTAAQQLLARGPVFRTGAAANVIFVSDTQDPGLEADKPWFDALVAMRPTGEELVATAAGQQLTASMRLHAIAPQTQCGGEAYAHIGDVYGDAARETGGRTLDICTAEPADYVALVRDIVADGAVPTAPVVPLERAERVRTVFVDGREVPWRLSRDQKAVVLDTPMPEQRSTVRIEYKAVVPSSAPALPARARAVAR